VRVFCLHLAFQPFTQENGRDRAIFLYSVMMYVSVCCCCGMLLVSSHNIGSKVKVGALLIQHTTQVEDRMICTLRRRRQGSDSSLGTLFHALFRIFAILLSMISLAPSLSSKVSASSNVNVPWQTSVSTVNDKDYKDLGVTIFAPSGRLISVEEAVAAIHSNPSSNTVLALKCRDGAVVVATLPRSPYLLSTDHYEDQMILSTSSSSPFLRLATNTEAIAVTAGNPVHSQQARQRVVALVKHVLRKNSDTSDALGRLARQLADQLQVKTQKDGDVLPVALFFVDATVIWRVDPTGQFWKFQAVASGRHAARVEQLLSEKLITIQQDNNNDDDDDNKHPTPSSNTLKKIIGEMSTREALRMATECVLQAYSEPRAAAGAKKPSSNQQNDTRTSVPLRAVVIGVDVSQEESQHDTPQTIRCYSGKELVDLLL